MNFIHEALVDLTLHEVGHTLGLRHNFKASSIYSIEQLSDKKFTQKYGISGSVMDYHPVSLFDNTKSSSCILHKSFTVVFAPNLPKFAI